MRRAVSLFALLAVLALSGCSSERAASPAPTPVGDAPPASAVSPTAFPEPQETVALPLVEPLDPQQQALEDAWRLPDPRGTVPQIALRFLQALQRGDDLAAERDLTHAHRFALSFGDLWELRVVMSDIRRHAGLAGASRCTRAAQIDRAAAVVTCGRRRVVLSVNAARWDRGVKVSDYTAHYDVYRGPHTHAYTTIEF
jgi:hypothetical protein